MGKNRNTYTNLEGNLQRKRPLEKYRQTWEVNIKIDLR
jgi:hypothetical protein